MRFRFRDKLVLAFAVLLLATMVPVLVLVNRQIEAISERKIEQDLRNTGRVLQRHQEGQLATYSERTANFILTQPEIRAEIVTAGEAEQQFGSVFSTTRTPTRFAPPAGTTAAKGEDPFGAVDAGNAPQVGGASAGSDPFGATAAQPGQVVSSGAQPQSQPGGGGDPFGAADARPDQVVSGEPAEADPFGAVSASPGQVSSGGAASGPVAPVVATAAPRPGALLPEGRSAAVAQDTEDLPERQNLILSIVQEVSLYRESAVFILTDFRGRVLFNKADPRRFGMDLAHLPAVRAALGGNEVFTWWGSLLPEPTALGLLPQADGELRLYQMFLKPVVFAREVKGLIAIGFPMTTQALEDVIGITQAEVAFLSDGRSYLNSLPDVSEDVLLNVGAARTDGDQDTSSRNTVQRFRQSDEDYLALRLPVRSTLGTQVGTVVVYRSKTQEQRVFNDLRNVLNAIGAVALIAAAVLAYAISHSVARVVRQLFHGVSAVREGDLDVHLDIRSRDEFGELGRAFNEMTAGLKEKEQIRSTFKRYVSSTVVDELLRSTDSVKLGGEAKPLTVQFSDIAKFSAFSESFSPEDVVEFLNIYLSQMTAEVEAEGGIVDKYIGDAVMAFWGAPMPLDDHADRACRAALGQIRRVRELRAGWKDRQGLANFNVRLGLHTGRVVVGNIGSESRMDYTIIGNAVNVASRLEGTNKVYGTNIIISDDTCNQLKGSYVIRELDVIRVIGIQQPVRIHELVGEDGEIAAVRLAAHERFAEGLALYRAQRFVDAAGVFAPLAEQGGDMAAHTFLQRCEEFRSNPPPADWDGVYQSTSK